MLNVTVIGTVRDSDDHLQSGTYTVEYKDRNITVPSTDTENSQINFNVGDHTHLGCNGSLRVGDVFYVNFTNSAANKFARRIHVHNGENVVLLNTICKDSWDLTTALSISEESDGVFKVKANGSGTRNIFRVYISKEKIVASSDPVSFTLVKTIDTSDDEVSLTFMQSIYTRVEVDTIIDGHTGVTESVDLDVKVGNNTPELLPQVFMIEWE